MGKAVLIYGGTFKDRAETLKDQGVIHFERSLDPDLLIIEKDKDRKSIGIASSREIKKFLQERPLNKDKKTVVVLNAELMTPEAQNALLKVIEEPPSYAEIFLLAKTENSLLETVTSRCIKKKVETQKWSNEGESEIFKILKTDLGARLDKAKDLSEMEKEELIDTLEKWVIDLRVENSSASVLEKIKKILETKRILEETNANTRLAMESLLLDL